MPVYARQGEIEHDQDDRNNGGAEEEYNLALVGGWVESREGHGGEEHDPQGCRVPGKPIKWARVEEVNSLRHGIERSDLPQLTDHLVTEQKRPRRAQHPNTNPQLGKGTGDGRGGGPDRE